MAQIVLIGLLKIVFYYCLFRIKSKANFLTKNQKVADFSLLMYENIVYISVHDPDNAI